MTFEFEGEFNPDRLSDDLTAAGLPPHVIDWRDTTAVSVRFAEDVDAADVEAVVASHDPTAKSNTERAADERQAAMDRLRASPNQAIQDLLLVLGL